MKEKVYSALKGNPVFAVLGDLALERLASNATVSRFQPEDILFTEGETGDHGYLILTGEVSIDVNTPGGAVCVAEIGAGRLVGEIGAFADVPRTASVRALTELAAVRLDRSAIRESMADNPDIALQVIGRLGLRLQNITRPMAVLTQAAEALRDDNYDPHLLDSLTDTADEFSHFSDVFRTMATELLTKRSQRHEMETATAIQQTFLPQGFKEDLGDFSIHAEMIAAKHVGGDFFDYFPIGNGRMGFLIADVSGKGVPAALFMAMSRTVMRTVGKAGADPSDCISQANDLIASDNEEDMFVTMFFGELDLASGELLYCNAGHDPALHVGADGALELLGTTGPAVGLFEGAPYQSARALIRPGDSCVLYSDGVTEAFDPDDNVYGEEKLQNLVKAARADSAWDIVHKVMSSVDAFASGRDRADDTTCLALVRRS